MTAPVTPDPEWLPGTPKDSPMEEGAAAEEQACSCFFARMEAELDESGIAPEPAWKARTIGSMVLDPLTYRRVIATCSATLVISLSWIGWHVHQAAQPSAPLALPPGYSLVLTSSGDLVAVADRCQPALEQERMREEALAELEMLLRESQTPGAADFIRVSAVQTPGQ